MKNLVVCLAAIFLASAGCGKVSLGHGHKHQPPGQERKQGAPPPGLETKDGGLPPGQQKKIDGCKSASKKNCNPGNSATDKKKK